jgi:hypothetical protein
MPARLPYSGVLGCIAFSLTSACSQSNNLFLGEVRATAGSHQIVVTDCYRFRVDPPQATPEGYRYAPCRDADVVIRNQEAIVNGRSYGHIDPNASILVDHGVVSIEKASIKP